jgi:hypothetical protein
MKSEAATAALLRYNADRSEQKRHDVQTALAELAEDPRQPINKSNVARRALLTELKRKSPHVNGDVAVSGVTVTACDRRW